MRELPIERVDSLQLPELAPYRTLRSASRPAPGIFVAEGSKVVLRMLESGFTPVSFLLTPDWLEALTGALPPLEAGVRLYVAERRLMEQIVGFRFHQGIMALGRIPPEPDPALLGADHLLVALDDIHHAENVGVIIRNAAALGADAVVAGETCSDPWLRRSVRNSMGGIFRLPVFRPERMHDFLLRLRATAGTRLIAADARAATPMTWEDFRGSVCVVAGNEECGVRPEILKMCDARVSIPMERNIDSLNVASAVAVFLHAARACRP